MTIFPPASVPAGDDGSWRLTHINLVWNSRRNIGPACQTDLPTVNRCVAPHIYRIFFSKNSVHSLCNGTVHYDNSKLINFNCIFTISSSSLKTKINEHSKPVLGFLLYIWNTHATEFTEPAIYVLVKLSNLDGSVAEQSHFVQQSHEWSRTPTERQLQEWQNVERHCESETFL